MTRKEFIEAYAARSGLEARFAAIGILDVGGRTLIALPCGCGNECEGWAMVAIEGVLPQLEVYAPVSLTAAYRETVAAWGGENTPEIVAWDVDPLVADHIVSLHNNSLVTS